MAVCIGWPAMGSPALVVKGNSNNALFSISRICSEVPCGAKAGSALVFSVVRIEGGLSCVPLGLTGSALAKAGKLGLKINSAARAIAMMQDITKQIDRDFNQA